jgi:ketosteroid isomerase-like protein
VPKVYLAVLMLMSVAAPAAASDTTDVLEVAHHWSEAFNQGSFKTDIAPCAEDAVVLDDLPPHVWQGAGACSKWYEAVMAWAEKAAVTKPAITLGKTSHLEFEAGYAYLVAPVTLSYIKAGKPVDFGGILTMTLQKGNSGWRVSGVAWADR